MRTTVHLACALALGVCSVAQPAQAKPAVWMEGTWSLDPQSSTSLDPVLRAMGYGWIARKVMSSLAVKQVIRATGRGISFRVITRFTDEAIVLPVDNRWAIGKNLDGGTTERRSRWLGSGGCAPDGGSLSAGVDDDRTASNQRRGLSRRGHLQGAR